MSEGGQGSGARGWEAESATASSCPTPGPRPLAPLFVTFEGPEGAGKTTQLHLLAERLRSAGFSVVTTVEPGGTPLGNQIRSILLERRELTIRPEAETFLFCTARAQLVADVIRPALARGEIVLCDRFADSTVAYQHFGRGLPRSWVEQAIALAIGDVRPHLTILLDLPPSIGMARKQRGDLDRMESAGDDFHERVHLGYHQIASAEPARWLVVDAQQPIRAIADAIYARVEHLLSLQSKGEAPSGPEYPRETSKGSSGSPGRGD